VVKDLCEAEEDRKDRDVYPGIFNVAYLTEERATKQHMRRERG